MPVRLLTAFDVSFDVSFDFEGITSFQPIMGVHARFSEKFLSLFGLFHIAYARGAVSADALNRAT